MQKIVSDDADIFYDIAGAGPPVILLHPFPVNHDFWLPVTKHLASRYRLIMPDLRGHGESGLGAGPATMAKHASDIANVMTDAGVDRAPLIGVSIGGYSIFELPKAFERGVDANGAASASVSGSLNTNYEVDDQEIRRGGVSYTIETVRAYANRFIDAPAAHC